MIKTNSIDSACWNVLIVDDKKDIHPITINAFYEEEIFNKEINFLSATNEHDAIELIQKHGEHIAVILLDLVLDDKGDEGLKVLDFLVNTLKNTKTQVILRTGYTGKLESRKIKSDFPEVRILEKGETEASELITYVEVAISKYIKC